MNDPLDRQSIEEFNTQECDRPEPEPEPEPDLRKFVADLKAYSLLLMGLGKEN